MVLEDAYKIIWGANPIKPSAPISGASELLGVMFPNYRLFLMGFGALLIFSVWALIYKTQLGAIVRASAYDKDMSSSLGIPVMRVYALTFALGVALAGLAGVLLAPIYSVFPTMGRDFILMAFSVVIVGGLGSIKGAVIAGILLTQLQSISSLYISPVWSDPLVFTVMVLVLMFKPTGLYGGMKNA
jgi:branched-chain amino acid transport system permease protein